MDKEIVFVSADVLREKKKTRLAQIPRGCMRRIKRLCGQGGRPDGESRLRHKESISPIKSLEMLGDLSRKSLAMLARDYICKCFSEAHDI